MAPKKKAGPKSKVIKSPEVPLIVEGMRNFTIRRPIVTDDNDDNQNGSFEDIDDNATSQNQDKNCSLEHDGNIYSNHQSRSKFEKETESNGSSPNEETLDEKPVKKKAVKEKPQKKTKMVNEGAKTKNTKRRSASVDRQLVEKTDEKVVSRSRKRIIDKDVPTKPMCDQPLKRNRRAVSVDILSSESSLPITKKIRKGSAMDKVEVNKKPKTTKKAVKATVKKTISKKKVETVSNDEHDVEMVDSEDPELTDDEHEEQKTELRKQEKEPYEAVYNSSPEKSEEINATDNTKNVPKTKLNDNVKKFNKKPEKSSESSNKNESDVTPEKKIHIDNIKKINKSPEKSLFNLSNSDTSSVVLVKSPETKIDFSNSSEKSGDSSSQKEISDTDMVKTDKSKKRVQHKGKKIIHEPKKVESKVRKVDSDEDEFRTGDIPEGMSDIAESVKNDVKVPAKRKPTKNRKGKKTVDSEEEIIQKDPVINSDEDRFRTGDIPEGMSDVAESVKNDVKVPAKRKPTKNRKGKTVDSEDEIIQKDSVLNSNEDGFRTGDILEGTSDVAESVKNVVKVPLKRKARKGKTVDAEENIVQIDPVVDSDEDKFRTEDIPEGMSDAAESVKNNKKVPTKRKPTKIRKGCCIIIDSGDEIVQKDPVVDSDEDRFRTGDIPEGMSDIAESKKNVKKVPAKRKTAKRIKK